MAGDKRSSLRRLGRIVCNWNDVGVLPDTDITGFLVNVRNILATDKTDPMRTLRTHCDWILHANGLDRSRHKSVLLRGERALNFVAEDPGRDMGAWMDRMLAPQALHNEIVSLGYGTKIPMLWCNDLKNWYNFRHSFFHAISGHPIRNKLTTDQRRERLRVKKIAKYTFIESLMIQSQLEDPSIEKDFRLEVGISSFAGNMEKTNIRILWDFDYVV